MTAKSPNWSCVTPEEVDEQSQSLSDEQFLEFVREKRISCNRNHPGHCKEIGDSCPLNRMRRY